MEQSVIADMRAKARDLSDSDLANKAFEAIYAAGQRLSGIPAPNAAKMDPKEANGQDLAQALVLHEEIARRLSGAAIIQGRMFMAAPRFVEPGSTPLPPVAVADGAYDDYHYRLSNSGDE